jgi:hypothetical protein
MKRLIIGVMAVAVGMGAARCGDDDNGPTGPSNTGPIVFTVQMSAANEVPAVTNAESGARGTATITLNVGRDAATGAVNSGGTVDWTFQLSSFPNGSTATQAHIHPGAAGASGGVFLGIQGFSGAGTTPIQIPNGTANGAFTGTPISQEQATQVVANPSGYYFNVHTSLNPGGAVRGQLVRQ